MLGRPNPAKKCPFYRGFLALNLRGRYLSRFSVLVLTSASVRYSRVLRSRFRRRLGVTVRFLVAGATSLRCDFAIGFSLPARELSGHQVFYEQCQSKLKGPPLSPAGSSRMSQWQAEKAERNRRCLAPLSGALPATLSSSRSRPGRSCLGERADLATPARLRGCCSAILRPILSNMSPLLGIKRKCL